MSNRVTCPVCEGSKISPLGANAVDRTCKCCNGVGTISKQKQEAIERVKAGFRDRMNRRDQVRLTIAQRTFLSDNADELLQSIHGDIPGEAGSFYFYDDHVDVCMYEAGGSFLLCLQVDNQDVIDFLGEKS